MVESRYQESLDDLPQEMRAMMLKVSAPNSSISPGRLSVLAMSFWLGDAFGINKSIQHNLALSNLYGLLHFIAQDNLSDKTWGEADRLALVVSSTIYLQKMFIGYQRYFPAESIFWRYVEKYWKEWGESLIWERSTGLQPSFSDRDLLMAARKAAPLKICSSGMALLGSREYLVPELELAVDRMHMVLQMADDFADLEEDLAGNRYNTFMSMMAVNGSLMPSHANRIDQIGHTIFRTVADGEFIQHMRHIAVTAQKDLDRLGLSQWGELISLIVSKTENQIEHHLEIIIPPDLDPVFDLSE